MMPRALLRFLAGSKKTVCGPVELYYLSAKELLRAQAEARALCADEEQLALYLNACVLAKSARRSGKRLFQSGEAVLEALPAETIARWIEQYQRACSQDCPPCTEQERQKLQAPLGENAYERLKWRVLRTFGVLPSEKRAEGMTDGDYLSCVMQMMLDELELLDGLCPSCREKAQQPRCTCCGELLPEQNAAFDETRFEELKRGDISRGNSAQAEDAGAAR